MTTRYDPSDGVSQLTEMMRSTPSTPLYERLARDPGEQRRRRRRRTIGLIVTGVAIVVIAALIGGYCAWALNAPVGAASASLDRPDVPAQPAAQSALSPEGESAISVSGGDDYLGAGASGVWQSSGDDSAPIASISKLITAMVILDAKPLSSATDAGPMITFDKADHDLYDKYYVLNATIAPMPTGSVLSEHNALETMLVVSACNYAEALADWAFGSVGGFDSATKKWLAKNGLTHTSIAEPTGLDSRNTSTPSDLIALGKLAMANPAIAAIVGTGVIDLPGTAVDGMRNTNDLLGSTVNGIKTGTLDDSGSDLLFSAKLVVPNLPASLTVIGVVLGGSSRASVDNDVSEMLDHITRGFHEVDLGNSGDVVGTYRTPWGASAHMVLDGSPEVFTWSDTKVTTTMTTVPLTTGSDRQKVGTVTYTAGKSVVKVPVVLDRSIKPPSSWWRLTHPGELGK